MMYKQVNKVQLGTLLVVAFLTILPQLVRAVSPIPSEFSEICKIFEEILPLKLSKSDKSEAFYSKLKKRIKNNELLDVFDIMPQIPPEARYATFKEIADKYTGSDWECVAMKTYVSPKRPQVLVP